MLDLLKTYVTRYATLKMFLQHKVTHVLVGTLVFMLGNMFSIPVAIISVIVVAVGKEVADQLQGSSGIEYHALDVLVTCLGILVGMGVCALSIPLQILIGFAAVLVIVYCVVDLDGK